MTNQSLLVASLLVAGGCLLLAASNPAGTVAAQFFGFDFFNPGGFGMARPASTVTPCATSGPSDLFQVTGLSLNPDPPVPGQPLTASLSGYLNGVVDYGSQMHVSVRMGRIPVMNRFIDMCEALAKGGVSCPQFPGPVEVTKTFNLPQFPAAEYFVTANFTNQDGLPISCAEVYLDARR